MHASPAAPAVSGEPGLACGGYAGIDRATAERFRKGDYPIDATLDLHGMSREKAHMMLVTFLTRHFESGARCLLVITGKGKKTADSHSPVGILRELLPRWLAEPGLKSMILALDVARPKHGGSGAYYLLLRRRR
jgi:DNA-nicking Smr family endonuclease